MDAACKDVIETRLYIKHSLAVGTAKECLELMFILFVLFKKLKKQTVIQFFILPQKAMKHSRDAFSNFHACAAQVHL